MRKEVNLSKMLVYRFYYKYMQGRMRDRAQLFHTDTKSLINEVRNADMYALIKTDLHKFDNPDYPANNQFSILLIKKKRVGLIKDECSGKIPRFRPLL